MVLTTSILWHESEEKNKKAQFWKFQLIPIYFIKLSIIMFSFIVLIDCCAELKWFQPNSFGEMSFLEKSYEKMKKWQCCSFKIREYAFSELNINISYNILNNHYRSLRQRWWKCCYCSHGTSRCYWRICCYNYSEVTAAS